MDACLPGLCGEISGVVVGECGDKIDIALTLLVRRLKLLARVQR
jgi:hypothetical protein